METLDIDSDPLDLDPGKFSTYLNTHPNLAKQKPNLAEGSIVVKINIDRLERVIGKFIRKYLHSPLPWCP